MRGDFPPVPRMADISDGFMELRCNAVPERERGFSEKKKYLKILCSIQKLQKNFLTETEVLMKCREKPESRLYIYTKQATYPQLLQVIVNTHEHEEQYIFTHSFLEIGLQTLKAKGSPKVCQHLLKRLLRTLSSFSYLQGQRLHRPSGQPVLAFNHHYSKKGSGFLCLNRVPCICCYAYCLLTFHWAPRKIWLSFYSLPSSIYIYLQDPPASFPG